MESYRDKMSTEYFSPEMLEKMKYDPKEDADYIVEQAHKLREMYDRDDANSIEWYREALTIVKNLSAYIFACEVNLEGDIADEISWLQEEEYMRTHPYD